MATISTTAPVTPLRQRMQHDMMMRGLLPRTQDQYSPNVARFERALCADHVACIPRTTPMSVWIKIRNSHFRSPLAELPSRTIGSFQIREVALASTLS